MKVLVIPTWYPNGEDKLMGIYHKEFTNALNKYGIDADMLYIARQRLKNPLKYFFMKKDEVVHERNYDVYIKNILNLGPINFHLQMKNYVHKLDKAFNLYLKTHPKPDILHAQVTVPAGYATVKIGKKYDIPVVITEHGGSFERFFKDDPYKKYGLSALKNAYFTTVSHYMQDTMLKYTNKCEVLPNQVDTTIFKNDKKRKIDGTFKLISVCALREGKRLDIAFKAIKKLIDKGIDIHYDIIGDGFYEDIFKKSAKENEVEEYITFHGRKNKKEIAKYMLDAHALLISSEVESFAIPGIEALASGLPVITTNCQGPRDFIDDTTGIIARINDPDDLAKCIELMIKNYSKYDKKHLEEVADLFSEKSVVEKAKKIYESLIEENSKRS